MAIDQLSNPFGPENRLQEIAEKYNDIWRTQRVGDMPPALIVDLKNLLPPGSSVLDLGAGPGRFSVPMAEAGFRLTAVDVSDEAMDQLAANAEDQGLDITTRVGDICAQLDTKQHYAAISAIFVLHYLRQQEAEKLIADMQNHTYAGGVHVLSAYSQQGDIYQENPHSGLFFPKDHSQFLSLYPNTEWEVLRAFDMVLPTPDQKQHNQVMHCLVRKN